MIKLIKRVAAATKPYLYRIEKNRIEYNIFIFPSTVPIQYNFLHQKSKNLVNTCQLKYSYPLAIGVNIR